MTPDDIPSARGAMRSLRQFLTRGPRHRRRLEDMDVRVSVMGTRGKSTLVRWLQRVLTDRDYDTYAKVTGDRPRSLYGGETHPIERTGQTTLYETEREIRRFDPDDGIIIENNGLREYTTRLVNTRYVDPSVVVLTNVRLDHLDTLGGDYRSIARALVRAIPDQTHVINGERNEEIRAYLERELAGTGVRLTHAEPAEDAPAVPSPATELGALLDEVLAALDEPPVSTTDRQALRDALRVEWTQIPDGRVYFAASANDVDSTEMIRRLLVAEDDDPILPLVSFRRDRPGRTATYLGYLNRLADRGSITRVHHLGAHADVTHRRLSVPVVTHDVSTADPGAVLNEALAEGPPVMVMGNAATEFVNDLQMEIDYRRRALERATERSVVREPNEQ